MIGPRPGVTPYVLRLRLSCLHLTRYSNVSVRLPNSVPDLMCLRVRARSLLADSRKRTHGAHKQDEEDRLFTGRKGQESIGGRSS